VSGVTPPAEIDGVPVTHVRVGTNGVHLHAAIAGAGPPVLLLHGFPEHWWSWRRQMPALARGGFSAWAVDLRGYHMSDRPLQRDAYRLGVLVDDIAGVVRATGEACCDVVGHDWGGIIAWAFAATHPDLLRRLVVLNAPHLSLFAREVRRPRQMLRSAYVPFFAIPALSEAVLSARDFAVVRAMFTRVAARPDAYSAADIEAFVAALRVPGALTAALNYYRANLRPSALQRTTARTSRPTRSSYGASATPPRIAACSTGWTRSFRVSACCGFRTRAIGCTLTNTSGSTTRSCDSLAESRPAFAVPEMCAPPSR